jgi:amino acid transporter/mannitol/fructose-specific phosphotransferase system IIA component (Ntr-type)
VRLKKELGTGAIFCIAAGAMISSGLFVLPGLAFAKAGPAVILGYLVASVMVIPSLLAKAELATAMPKAGGTYFYIERSLGPAVGVFGGLANWFSLSLKSAFALMGMGVFAILIYPPITELQIKLVAVGCCLFFTVLNLVSVKGTGRFQIYLVASLLSLLVLYIIRGVGFIDVHRYTPFAPHGLGSVLTTAGLVFVSFGGVTKVASIAEEAKDPRRSIPLGMILAFVVVALLYLVVVSITVGVTDPGALSGSRTPISTGARALAGPIGGMAMALAALMAFITTANAGILSASRFPMAMSRDQLIPGFFQRVNGRFQTPYVSILLTSSFMIGCILFLSLEDLIKTASTFMILLFLFVNVSLIIMRASKIPNYRPTFRAPLCPWLQIAGIIVYGFLIFGMGRIPLMITVAFALAGFAWYLIYVKHRVTRQSALMHVVERITARELAGVTLRDELREIIKERDRIVEDRFDRLIKEAEILDIPERVSSAEVFDRVCRLLSPKLKIDPEELLKRFQEREKQSSTIIRPGLAIPHIIVPGEHLFEILVVRCCPGIRFPDVEEPVTTMFILVGSLDERNYHLRALMAIAQVAQEAGFEERWLCARDVRGLRDLILLSGRKRDVD